jgi:hypothetical protein
MSFTIVLILLIGMGFWVVYHLVTILRRGDATGDKTKPKPLLYWIVFIAQMLFLMGCLSKLFREIF